MKPVPAIAVLAALSVGCSELVIPEDDQLEFSGLEYRFPSDEAYVLASDLKCMGGLCDIEFNSSTGRHTCVCKLDGIGTDPPPPPAPPPIWPISWPTAPGWVRDVGGGGGGGGGDDSCDDLPPEFPGCYEFQVRVACDVGIVRGAMGRCTVGVPGARSFSVSKWSFKGATITNTWSSNSIKWEGPLIESGEVRVDVMVQGIPATGVSQIEVKPRTTGRFTQSAWAASMKFFEEQGCTNYAGTRPHGVIAWAGSHKAAQEGRCYPLTIDPQGGTGYEIEVPQEGPNKFGVYIRNPTWYYHGTSRTHPGKDLAYPLTDSAQAAACGSKPGTAMASFNSFNAVCKQVGHFGTFWSAVRKHEKQHWENGRIELMKPTNNLYTKTEHCVGPFTADPGRQNFNDCLITEHVRVQQRLRAEAAPEPDQRGQIFWAGAGNRWWIWLCDEGAPCGNEFGYTNRKF
ncbi:MAG: hypothetical protein ACREM1_15550 [Longimicrobiales bacterium]